MDFKRIFKTPLFWVLAVIVVMLTVFSFDGNGDYVYVNPSYSRALGYSAEELLNKNAFDFIHAQDRDKARRELKQHDGTTILRFQHQNGSWKWFQVLLCVASAYQ